MKYKKCDFCGLLLYPPNGSFEIRFTIKSEHGTTTERYNVCPSCHRKVRMATYDLRTWSQGKKESGE